MRIAIVDDIKEEREQARRRTDETAFQTWDSRKFI